MIKDVFCLIKKTADILIARLQSVDAHRWLTIAAYCPFASTPMVPHQKLKWLAEGVK